MKKKFLVLIVIIIIILFVLVGGFIVRKVKNKNIISKLETTTQSEKQEELKEQELEDMEYVDSKIEQLMSNKEYNELSTENKITEIKELLNELKKNKYIKNYSYDSSNQVFSYEYSCGVLGGISLKEFDSVFN